MELVFNGNKVVVSVEGQRAASVYCVDYKAGLYDVVFNDDVVEQNPLPIFEQLLVNASERVPELISHEANTWRYSVPNPVLDLSGIQARHDGDKIHFTDNARELFYAVLVGEETYNIIEVALSELCFNRDLNDLLAAKFVELFNQSRDVQIVDGSVNLYFMGSVDDHPLDMFHVQTTGHGVFHITSAAGRVGEMHEFALAVDDVGSVGVDFVSYNGSPFPDAFCRELYKRATGYSLGECVSGRPLRYAVDVHGYLSLTDIEMLHNVIGSGFGEDNALIAIREILPSVVLTVQDKHYAIMPVFVDPRDTREHCSGNVVYRGKPIGKGLALPRGYLCMEATDEICNILNPVATKGPSAIPVAIILEAFMMASDVRDELRISPFEPTFDRRGDGRRDRGISRGHRRSDIDGRSRRGR